MLEFPDDISLKTMSTCSNETIIQFVPLVQSIRSHGLVSYELLHATYTRRDLSPVQSIDSFKIFTLWWLDFIETRSKLDHIKNSSRWSRSNSDEIAPNLFLCTK